jgi:hypothetical protein
LQYIVIYPVLERISALKSWAPSPFDISRKWSSFLSSKNLLISCFRNLTLSWHGLDQSELIDSSSLIGEPMFFIDTSEAFIYNCFSGCYSIYWLTCYLLNSDETVALGWIGFCNWAGLDLIEARNRSNSCNPLVVSFIVIGATGALLFSNVLSHSNTSFYWTGWMSFLKTNFF